MKGRFVLQIFILLTFCGYTTAQVKVQSQLDKGKILIGDHVRLYLTAEHPKNINIQWPLISDSIGKLEVLEKSKIDTIPNTDKNLITEKGSYVITSFDTGFYPIPPIEFYYTKEKDTTRSLAETEAILLSVYAPKVDTTKAIRDIKGPMDIPFTFAEILPWLLLVLLLTLIGFAIWYYIRRRKGKPVFIPEAPPRPAHEIALEELEKLQQEKLWQKGSVKEYHSILADIIRTYFERRFSINAMEMTTDEILAALRTEPSIQEPVSQLLRLSDLVKFAKVQPIGGENEQSLKNAFEIVRLTTRPDHTEIAETKE